MAAAITVSLIISPQSTTNRKRLIYQGIERSAYYFFKNKERLSTKMQGSLNFAAVVTLKVINGINQI